MAKVFLGGFGVLIGIGLGLSSETGWTRPHPEPKLLAAIRAPGAITEMALTESGHQVWIATKPESEISTSSKQHLLSVYQSKGSLAWRLPLKYATKNMALAPDGSLAVLTNYQNEILGISAQGKILWTTPGTCQPLYLEKLKKIVCFHDDDADPDVAYDVFDLQGKKTFSFPTTEEILHFKVSADERYFLFSSRSGQLFLVDVQGKVILQKKVEGQIADLAVFSGDPLRVFVLINNTGQPTGQPKVLVLNREGKPVTSLQPSFRPSQIEVNEDGTRVAYYGNGKEGQLFGVASIEPPKELWRRSETRASDFSQGFRQSGKSYCVGFERSSAKSRESLLEGLDSEGKPLWTVHLQKDKSAYLYQFQLSKDGSTLAAATDDGRASVFKM